MSILIGSNFIKHKIDDRNFDQEVRSNWQFWRRILKAGALSYQDWGVVLELAEGVRWSSSFTISLSFVEHEQLMHSARFRGLIRHPKYSVSVLATFSSLPYSVSAKIFGLNFSLEKSIRWQQPFFWPVDSLTVIRSSIYDEIEYTPATLLILSLRYAMPTSCLHELLQNFPKDHENFNVTSNYISICTVIWFHFI